MGKWDRHFSKSSFREDMMLISPKSASECVRQFSKWFIFALGKTAQNSLI